MDAVETPAPAARFNLRDLISEWDPSAAVALMVGADDEVERCGSVGADPGVQAAVGRMVGAYAEHDLAGVRAGAEEVKAAARRVARPA